MNKDYFKIKDECRQGLLTYLKKAFSFIPKEGDYRMLDIGCGTGVPTLFMAEHFSGDTTALDTDKPALDFFRTKLIRSNLKNTISIQEISFFDFMVEKNGFDIILAEGLLNVIGFEKGFAKALEFLKPGGYFIIHDEFKNHQSKVDFIAQQNCTLIDSLYLDDTIWWKCYYEKLANQIDQVATPKMLHYFKRDIAEIEYFKSNADAFRSVYYVVNRN